MQSFGRANNVGELIELLKKIPPEHEWFGYDDQSIIIEDRSSGKSKEVGFIKNKSWSEKE